MVAKGAPYGIFPSLSNFDDYSWEPKEAPKDPKEDLYKNRLRYTTGYYL